MSRPEHPHRPLVAIDGAPDQKLIGVHVQFLGHVDAYERFTGLVTRRWCGGADESALARRR
ncbi:hypothetical protein [Gemmatirosa kalamazoonensis]|uniref:hypothetical protein n=1 Tax=Gemmatirosa kalamazoonensis TaxID=861299 RepID=UPI00130DA953|nr:hypothetical protein [Gemmatirosa kalamazoonensis]